MQTIRNAIKRPLRRWAAAGNVVIIGGNIATLAVTVRPAMAASPGVGAEVRNSRLPGFKYFELPGYAHRLNDARLEAELAVQLRDVDPEAAKAGYMVEVVAWQGNNASDDTRVVFRATCLGSGRQFEEDGDRFAARSDVDKSSVSGFWTRRDGVLLLVWGTAGPPVQKATTPIGPSEVSPQGAKDSLSAPTPIGPSRPYHPEPIATTAVPAGPGHKMAAPTPIVGGTWNWTTISGTTYVHQSGNLASPSGMSAKFSFGKDGSYTYFFYVQQRTYNFVTQSTTTENGQATFYDNGTVVLTPAKGHYIGLNGGKGIDRDMTASERKPRTFYWEWRTVGVISSFLLGQGGIV